MKVFWQGCETVVRFGLGQKSRHGAKSWWIASLGEEMFSDSS